MTASVGFAPQAEAPDADLTRPARAAVAVDKPPTDAILIVIALAAGGMVWAAGPAGRGRCPARGRPGGEGPLVHFAYFPRGPLGLRLRRH
jgi:hypothetical protein